jgi:hypothetical protein
MLASTALAQAAGDPVGAGNAVAEAGPIKDLETLVVTGVQPGPGLWRVSHEGNVLWILGTVSSLPAKMEVGVGRGEGRHRRFAAGAASAFGDDDS